MKTTHQTTGKRGSQELIKEVAPNYFQTGEQQEGASAFLEKRKPDFSLFR